METVEDLHRATSLEDLIEETARQATRLGARAFVYSGRAQYSLATSRQVMLTATAELRSHLRAAARNGCDPFTGSLQRALLPRERPLQGCIDRDTDLFRALEACGVRTALVVPLPGRDGGSLAFLFGANGAECDAPTLLREALYVTTVVAERVRLIALAMSAPDEARSFTTRELDVIDYFLAGATLEETASAAGISLSGTRFHLQNIYTKLGAGNQRQAVARLVELGCLRRGNIALLGAEWTPRSGRGGMRGEDAMITSDRRRKPRAPKPKRDVHESPAISLSDTAATVVPAPILN